MSLSFLTINQIDEDMAFLAKIASKNDPYYITIFCSDENAVSEGSICAFVTQVYDHIKSCAPYLNVPHYVPRITFSTRELISLRTENVFSESDPVIFIRPEVRNKPLRLKADVCQSIVRYILQSNEINIISPIDEKRLTETALFLFGLGEVFTAGALDSAKATTDYDDIYAYMRWKVSCFKR